MIVKICRFLGLEHHLLEIIYLLCLRMGLRITLKKVAYELCPQFFMYQLEPIMSIMSIRIGSWEYKRSVSYEFVPNIVFFKQCLFYVLMILSLTYLLLIHLRSQTTPKQMMYFESLFFLLFSWKFWRLRAELGWKTVGIPRSAWNSRAFVVLQFCEKFLAGRSS